ncbi:MAG: DNA-deoxyinosine glycosylase [Clostridiales bacterium]|nr:DNA-deoxyinosine glycosylase [Clostridiales bacterium]
MPGGLPPVEDRRAEVLVLGTMPSEMSLLRKEYYGNPRNAFWPLLYALWDEPLAGRYEERRRFVLDRHIALWDVLATCEREGSADAAIRRPVPNDFAAFAAAHPHLRLLVFNSRMAEQLYGRLVIPDPFAALDRLGLPSSSPARAMRFEHKLEAWTPLKRALER